MKLKEQKLPVNQHYTFFYLFNKMSYQIKRSIFIMNEREFVTLILDFMKDEVVEFEKYGHFEVTLNLKDVNLEIAGVDWNIAIKQFLIKRGYNVRFEFGDENWVTIFKN
jgi:hypothetical protein